MLLELLQNLQGQGFDELLQDMEQWIRIIKSNALHNGWFTGPDKEKDNKEKEND